MKTCTRCKESKSTEAFQRDRSRKDGLRPACKACSARSYRAWRDADPERARMAWRKASNKYSRATKYGITREQLIAMYERQDHRCAICRCSEEEVTGRNPGIFHIDHDHSTGAVRGLLCARCNTGLGQFLDDLQLVEAAAEYLREVQDREERRCTSELAR